MEGYLSVALIYHGDRKNHTLINTRSFISTIPDKLIRLIDPDKKFHFYWDPIHKRNRVKIKVTAMDHNDQKVTFEWGFAVSHVQSRFPTIGTDFLRSAESFENLTANHLVLKINQNQHKIPLYLSTANEFFNKGSKMIHQLPLL